MKRLFSLFLCLLMIVGCFAGCKKETVPTVASGEQITRGAWVKLLSDSLYLNSTTEKPYFPDIVKDDELFNAVQACVDLGIIEAGDLFNKGNPVTYKEIALNAVNAIGISTVQDYLKTDKELSEKQLLKFATDKDIIKTASEKFATTTDAQKAVKTAVTLYLNKPFVEKEKIELNDDIIDLKDQKISVTNDSIIYNKANKLKVGDIIILSPTDEHVGGVARKVESILGNIVNTTTPKLEEVYKTIQLSSVTVPKTSDIKPANEGVSFENYSEIELTSAKSKPQVTTLALNSKNNSDVILLGNKGASFNVNINITKGKLSIDEGWNSLSGSFSEEDIKNNYPQFKFDKNGNMYTSKYKGGYEIKGKISISDLSLTNDVDFSLVKGLKKAETKVNFNASVNLSVKGKINETIDVFTTSIPIGTTGLWVDAVFSLVFDANGDVSVKCTLENTTTYTYEKGLKSANNSKLNNKAAIAGNLSAKVGPRAVLVALGIDLFDIQAMIGLSAKAKISAEQVTSEIPCVDVKVYAPTLTIAFAGDKNTLINQLGFSATWKVYDIEGGWQKPLTTLTYHYEAKNGWVDKCTHPGKAIEGETSSQNNNFNTNSARQYSGTDNNRSSSSNNNKSESSSKQVRNPESSSSTSQQTMPSTLTSSNINNSEVFAHFANLLRDRIGKDIITYNGHITLGYDEAKVTLALMNYEYLNNTLISEVFGAYSKEQLKQFGDFMVVFVGTIADRKVSLNWNKFFINKTIGNYVVSFGNELVKVFKDQTNNADETVASFYDQNSSINYNNVNSWVNYYVSFLCNAAYKEHPGSISLSSLAGGNFQEEYYEDINSIYFRSRV